jgi:hypothetical protein
VLDSSKRHRESVRLTEADFVGEQFVLAGKALGEHEFQVQARNSKGTEPMSDSVFVNVA